MDQMERGISAGRTNPPVNFSEQDLGLFSRASGDRNPLHLSQDYARRTSYGQQVVFGCLGAIACLGRIALRDNLTVLSLDADFLRPIFLSVNYRVEISEKPGTSVARMFDGSLPVLSLALKTGSETRDVSPKIESTCFFERRDPAVRDLDEIAPGLSVSGEYATDPVALDFLSQRWGRVDPSLTAILAWSSYLVGMELPGASALFSKIALKFADPLRPLGKMIYKTSVLSLDSRFNRVRMEVALGVGDQTVASGNLWSFVQPPTLEVEEKDPDNVRADSLSGRVAVVIGASRGLGAATKRALECRGATVYSMARSASADESPRSVVGDASDPEALSLLKERVLREQGRLDFLICNACPPIPSLRMEANSAERIRNYIDQAVSLALTPLCSFLQFLNENKGCAVIISSLAVEKPVREWPHYLAAKQAVEMLAQVASLQYPAIHTVIVRPPRLLTALTNTPLTNTPSDHVGATSPGLFADRLVKHLENPLVSGEFEILD